MNNNVEKLLNETGKLVVAQNERTKERYSHGELFNVFNILGFESKEVRLHSALLAELLSPNGMIAIVHNDIYAPSFGISSRSKGNFYRYPAINYIILRKP